MPRPKLEMFRWTAESAQLELGYRRQTFLRRAAEANVTLILKANSPPGQKRLELIEEQMQKLALEKRSHQSRDD